MCDIDWPRRALTVNETQMWVKGEHVVKGPKTESGVRTIPLPEWLIEQLAASRSARAEATGVRPAGTDRMFVSPTGKPMYDHTLWRIVHNAQIAADLPRFRPYDLRHTHASLLIDLDAHPRTNHQIAAAGCVTTARHDAATRWERDGGPVQIWDDAAQSVLDTGIPLMSLMSGHDLNLKRAPTPCERRL